MLSLMMSLLFVGTLIGSLAAVAIMLARHGTQVLDALAGHGGLARETGESIAPPRHAAIRASRFRPAVRAARPGLCAAA